MGLRPEDNILDCISYYDILQELIHVISDFSEEMCFMSGLLMENYKRFAAGELTALRSKHVNGCTKQHTIMTLDD